MIAALQLFREKGFNNVSTRDLTQKLNISRSHIYHYYSNWETLKKSAIKYMFDNDIEECHATFKASESMSARVCIGAHEADEKRRWPESYRDANLNTPDTALQDIAQDADSGQYPDGTIERRGNGTTLPFMTDDRLSHPRTSP